MLILSRKVGQSIVINGNVIVKVVRVDGDQIKLGIQAPEEVRVDREEIHLQKVAGIAPPATSSSSPLKRIFGLGE